MKKIIATVVFAFAMATSFACEWNTFADYEVWCYEQGIEPNYAEYEYYADKDGQCYPSESEESELSIIMNNANAD